MKKKQILTSISDFKELINMDGYYLDKTAFIKEWLYGDRFTLITRPRRFGKTLTLSMLKYFFDMKEDSKHLFEGLAVSKDKEFCKEHINKYPVISITFKSVKENSWKRCYEKIKNILAEEYDLYEEVIENLNEREKKYFKNIQNLKGSEVDYQESMKKLSIFVSKYYGIKTMLFIDEYDTPIHQAFISGYYNEAMGFFRDFYEEALKENQGVEKSLTTGILRISKESMFSGTNNLTVLTILEEQYGQYLGFSEAETKEMLSYFEREDKLKDVRDWYNGYKFGNHIMYNPWSVSNFSKTGVLEEHWVNTGNTNILDRVIGLGHEGLKDAIPKLLSGEVVKKEIEKNISFKDILTSDVAAYGLLLFAGYLSWTKGELIDGKRLYSLRVPNLEVKKFLKGLIPKVTEMYAKESKVVFESLERRDWASFACELRESVLSSMSAFDMPDSESEKLYHLYILGLLVNMNDRYEVRSNRESGIGRYDIAMYPREKGVSGIIFEFKRAGMAEVIEEAAEDALKQIESRNYEQDFKDRGIEKVDKVGIAFYRKRLAVKVK